MPDGDFLGFGRYDLRRWERSVSRGGMEAFDSVTHIAEERDCLPAMHKVLMVVVVGDGILTKLGATIP